MHSRHAGQAPCKQLSRLHSQGKYFPFSSWVTLNSGVLWRFIASLPFPKIEMTMA